MSEKYEDHLPDDLIQVDSIFGKVLTFRNDIITNQIIKFGAHTRPELAMLLTVIASGDAVFDLGAHIGTYTIPIARKIGTSGRVLAVEGLPKNFDVLLRNLDIQELRGIVMPLNVLIAPENTLYSPVFKERNSGGTHFESSVADQETVSVRISGIDELCTHYFAPRVIKIDIEGFEAFALSASQFVQDKRPIIYCEISATNLARADASVSGLENLFRTCDYRLFRNITPRNAATDLFSAKELWDLAEGGDFFDVLAIPEGDPRIEWLVR